MSNFKITEAMANDVFGDQAIVFDAAAAAAAASPVPPANPVVPAADDIFFDPPFFAAGLEDYDLVFPANPAPLAGASPVPAFAADDGHFAAAFFAGRPEEDPALVFPARPAPLAAVPAVPAAAPAASVPVAAVDNSSFPADNGLFPADVANPAMSDNEFNVDMGNIAGNVGGNDGDNLFGFGMGEAVDGGNNNNNDGWAYLYEGNGSVNNDGSLNVNVQMPENLLDALVNEVPVAGTPAPGPNQADNLGPRLQAGEGYAQGGMEAPQPAVPSPVMLQPEPVAAPVQQGVPYPQAVQPQMPPASRPLPRFPAPRPVSWLHVPRPVSWPPVPRPLPRFPAPLQVPDPILAPLQQQQYQQQQHHQHHQQQHQQQQGQQQQHQQQQQQGQQQQHQQQQQQQGQQQQQQQQHQVYQPWKFAKKVEPKTFSLEVAAGPIQGTNVSLAEQLRQHVREREAFDNDPLRQGQAGGQPSQPLPVPQGSAAPAAPAPPNADAPPVKRGPGRPKGAKNKNPRPRDPAAPAAAAAAAATPPPPDANAPPARRGPGRPKGAKNKNPRPRDPLHRVRDDGGSRVAKARPRSAANGEQILAAAAAAAAAANEGGQRPVEGMDVDVPPGGGAAANVLGQPPGQGGNMYGVHAAWGGNAQLGGHVDVEEIIGQMRANGTFTDRQEMALRALYDRGM
ncbi:hypothetical protein GE21DRAFT_5262 [Neurospora crassa]|uniref:Uncharacterized protein n=1 Tax=Neurospora crassa (strain ATCC 24698 / 74-OR23-1A / CBS 708.71 / DSM 1257 / FGSC 987) TaxID=367110 RepID=Q7SB00_NEUCR|nr:hypothetical protein NCU07625 [Neurospora crassa OR74A]EAA33564.1 hypothetical protein NCU07625 [Neurospora crassa OR74A]KHE84223.1 hypothetical protein GE21DRAFT_5262 [Neurospora crassa]|eukprot:XP_962800.1 hypothetical protein NCU07625 [Neurospora crassa OR74A]